MNRRQFINGLLSCGLSSLACGSKGKRKRPNFLIFMADDLGYTDLSCFGSQQIKTPVLDRLAEQGTRFTHFYASAPNCSPSRAGLLSGRYPVRAGIYSYIPPQGPMHLKNDEITLASLLSGAGYDSAHMGKWHLCSDLENNRFPSPADHGFSYWFATENNAVPSHANPENFIRNGKAMGKINGYACQIVADEALRWLQSGWDRQAPFFLNVWFHEPHRKVAAPAGLVQRHQGHPNADYFACVENMDSAIGRVLSWLEDGGLYRDTVVLFCSDNGSYRPGSNDDFRGRKSFVFEGGIRVPAIIRWPGVAQKGSVSTQPVWNIDILPTFCRAASVELPHNRKFDGVDWRPLFRHKTLQRRSPMFWFFYRTHPAWALRSGKWMLTAYASERVPPGHSIRPSHMEYIKTIEFSRFELYDISADPAQTKNVAAKQPQVFERLRRQLVDTHQQVIEKSPVWHWTK